jgi:hypothetical protein
MFGDLLAVLVATVRLGPVQAQGTAQLAEGRAPAAGVLQVTECAAAAAPRLVERAGADPWWAIRTAFGAWIGTTRPEAVLADAAPGCGPAMQAARPFLGGN